MNLSVYEFVFNSNNRMHVYDNLNKGKIIGRINVIVNRYIYTIHTELFWFPMILMQPLLVKLFKRVLYWFP